MKTLPLEIWSNILHAVPKKDLRRCLGVCSLWHDFGIKLVFHTIHLYFGSWPEECGNDVQTFVRRSQEMLTYISSKPSESFASTVENIVVHGRRNYSNSSAQATLSTALKGLPQLLSFEWHSEWHFSWDWPWFPDEILNVLCTSCPQLRHLGLPTLAAGLVYDAFKQLRSISVTSSDVHLSSKEFLSVANSDTFHRTGLHRLQLSHWSLAEASGVGSPFIHLRELVFISTDECDSEDLELILKHTARLESLELHQLGGLDICSLLGNLVQNLPSLTSLMLSGNIFEPYPDGFELVRAFIESHSYMKRLCIKIPIEWKYIDVFMPAIHGMTQLEALGLMGMNLDSNTKIIPSLSKDFASAIESIPRSLQALALGTMLSSYEGLIHDLSAFPSLGFLLMLKMFEDSDPASLPSPQILVDKIPHLTMVGSRDDICNVTHGSNGKRDLVCWTELIKKRTRVADDLDMAHAAWLLYSHD
ncbi:hypothetical protein BJ138DRAFT_1122232 [Hygrophoropsis aurantiaca]|uniref:Uncharacterized protein n=1 Tax=Hygrophoropsis aurantiaca TaxID=72124 RepID=A0ACB8ASB7_9AGAM|nr:hypothetical protein BJ138DRAFT_1122232 [Hygrophoropsis aurantiaca]